MKAYDPNSFFEFLGYGPGDQTYNCPALRSLAIYCCGRRDQLETLLAPTPFELADTRFMVSIADFANNSTIPYFDAAIILAVTYREISGGTYYFEWEDQHHSVALGREVWGYPKHFANIDLTDKDEGVTGRVGLDGAMTVEAAMRFDDSASGTSWADLSFYPHLQVRAVPQVNGPSFDSFDILSRNTAKDFKLTERRYGTGSVTFGPEIRAGGQPLEAVAVVGAEYTIGDFYATRENGTPKIVASLI